MPTKTVNPNPTNEAAHKSQVAKPAGPVALTQPADLASLQQSIDTSGLARPADVLALQRTVGNRATTRLIQAKLTVGAAHDRYEQEADRVAQQVMTMPAPAHTQPAVQRQAEEEEEIQTMPLAASITPLVQRAVEEEEELQTKPIVQRAPEEEEELQAKPDIQRASSGAGFEVSGDFEQQLAASRGGGSPLPVEVRSFMEPRFGADFSGVRIHSGSESAQLNRSVSAQAFTIGQDIYLGEGKSDIESSQGKQLLAHELTHVVQQTGAAASPIQRLAIDDARIRVEQERKYREAASLLETQLGAHLSPLPEVNEIADDMLARLRKIVDAWAEATKTGKEKAYAQEFTFPTGQKYYGSFVLTGKEIKKVFERKDKPLRKKLNLIYYCVRNGNLGKYLELAANELRTTAKTGKSSSQKALVPDLPKVEDVKTPIKEVTVKKGFAQQSGLKDMWEQNLPVPKGKTSKEEIDAELEKLLQGAQKKKNDTRPVFGSSWTGLSRGESNKQLGGDKVYDGYKGLSLEDTQTLTHGDVGDITTSEMRLLYKRQGKRQPLWISKDDKEKFKRDTTSKILWEQGGENIEVVSDSATRRIAAETLSRLEGGISGSTDLMMHASKHLGYTDVNDLKRIRLALVAWMLSNRDHSFFEIMKVAADHGPEFHLDKLQPGLEYEHLDNFYPLKRPTVEGFKDLLPDKKMPSYYMAGTYKTKVDTGLADKGKSSTAFFDELILDGLVLDASWKNDAKAPDLAQWIALKNHIAGLGLKTNRTEEDLKFNRIAVQHLLKDSAWQHVVQASVDVNARANLRALLLTRFGVGAVVSDANLTTIGVPPSLFTSLDEYKRYDVYRLYVAVQQAAPGMKGATSSAHTERVEALKKSLPFQGVKAWVGRLNAGLILSSMLKQVLGDTRTTSSEKLWAEILPGYAAYQSTYKKLSDSVSHMKTLGIPVSWLDWVGKQTSEPLYAHFWLDELDKKVGGAGFVIGEPPTSPTNQSTRKTLSATREYGSLLQILKKHVPTLLTYLIEKRFGAKALTAQEHQVSFEALLPKEQVDELTALGVPRDVAEAAKKEALLAVHLLRRAVLEAPFNSAQNSAHKSNKDAWAILKSSTVVKGLAKHAGFKNLAVPIAATMVRQLVGPGVLSKDALMLATGTDQRMARVDKTRLGRTQVMDTTTLETPSVKTEAPPTTEEETTRRDERYWATTDASAEFKTNIEGKSPTVKAKLGAFKKKLTADKVERAKVFRAVVTKLTDGQAKEPKLSFEQMEQQVFGGTIDGIIDQNIAENIETALGYMDTADKLAQLDPETKGAIDAIASLSPRERGALYQYTNKLHEEIGYATQQFSLSDDFEPKDVTTVTEKLRSLRFMLPILQALNSAMEKLPAYQGSKVYSGRDSGAKLTGLDDQGRLDWAAKRFPVGQVISYAYPLSTAKDVRASFIPNNGIDIGLEIEQPILTGKDIEYISNKPNEKEVLFPQGVRFKVVSYKEQPPVEVRADDTKNKLWVVLQEV